MSKMFFVELYCESEAQSIRNMIADVLHEGFIKSVEVAPEEAAEHSLHMTALRHGLAISMFMNFILLLVVMYLYIGGR